MSILQSRNPAMRVLENEDVLTVERQSVMTLRGTVNATFILLAIVATAGILTWNQVNAYWLSNGTLPGWILPFVGATLIAGLVVGFWIYKAPKHARFIAPLHAAVEGAFVGAFSFYAPHFLAPVKEGQSTNEYAMMAGYAALATIIVAGTMLIGYASGILRVGPLMQKVIITLGAALALYVLALWITRLVGFTGLWNGFWDTGPIGLGFTVLCVGLASLFLLLDFQYIEAGVQQRAPKHMEWVGAWGLMVTLVWLYIEILRLIAKLRANE